MLAALNLTRSPTSPTASSATVDPNVLDDRSDREREQRVRANADTMGKMVSKWIGTYFVIGKGLQENYLLKFLEDSDCNPKDGPMRAIFLLDKEILSGTHYTPKEERQIRNGHWDCVLKTGERVQTYWGRYAKVLNRMETIRSPVS